MDKKIKVHFQRFEFKYQMPLSQAEGMIPEFLKYMDFDPYGINLPNNAYTVTSLYYDSVGLGCYHDKIAGVRTRKKIRVRTYEPKVNSQTPVFLEIKRKYDTVVVKDRLKMTFDQSKKLIEDNQMPDLKLDNHDTQTLDEFMWLKNKNSMIPQDMVIYKRKSFISKVDKDFRVTIDYDLRTYLTNSVDQKGTELMVNPGMAILELKFNNIMPFWFHRIIQRYSLQQRPFSKYCSALEVCKPVLIDKNIAESYQRQMGIIST